MAKKDKKNKKKQPGDWSDDEADQAKSPALATQGRADDEDDDGDDVPVAATSHASRFNFADLGDADGADDDDADDGEGGLMAAVRASEKRKKEKKKKKGAHQDLHEDADGDAEPVEVDLSSKAPIEMTAEQLMEEEFGPVKPKGKGKKGKKGKPQQADDFDEDEWLAQEAAKNLAVKGDANTDAAKPEAAPASAKPSESQAPDQDDDDEGDGVTRVLSKKEKEKLKKEKEKAKKKAQAAAKKASATAQPDGSGDTAAAAAPAPAATSESAAVEDIGAGDDAEDDGSAAGAAKNKKKKKKGAAQKAEEAPAKAAAPKKVPAHIAAMRAALEQKKAAEEEARRREEEERRRIEEEEQRQAELERQKEEEKKRKKEKEKAKIEQLKKEGKYMTPKQKQEAALAKARRDAMIASGQIKVEGLEKEDSAKPKKPTFSKKKPTKKGAQTRAPTDAASPVPSSPNVDTPSISEDPTREVEHESSHAEAQKPGSDKADVKGDWDAESEPEPSSNIAATAQEELDDWDAESVEDEKPKAEAVASQAVDVKTAPHKGQERAHESDPKKPLQNGSSKAVATTPVSSDKAAAATKKTAAKAVESESEEDEDSDDDDDSDDSEDSDDSDEDSESDDERISARQQAEAQRKAEAQARREEQRKAAIAAGSKDNLRSPICCILGHVDTGKTKLLDKIRQTNVQEGEAGGITQQIGATYFPMEAIEKKTAVLGEHNLKEYKLPGLLVIDTPGHESFTNLRTRGSSLCNIAILVVDIMHGLEPQTLESIRLLRAGKTPFIVALNKIDRLYGWNPTPDGSFRDSLANQQRAVQNEFDKRLKETMLAFAEQGLNALPYYENTNFAKNVSLIPTSAHTGEGIPDLLMLLVKLSQERMSSQLMYITELECTVLEVKVIEGLGTTLDVVLVNGIMREGDRIVVCGLNGPIVSQVRALLTPQPLKELRVKGQYVHHKEVKASLGVKIVAPDLEKAIAGSRLLVVGPDDDEDDLKDEVMEDLQTIMKSVDRTGKGVYVQASTLGSLEALLEFLRVSKIPVSGINIGPVHKKDITRCAVMLDRAPEFAVVLAFDVEIDKDAARMAEELNIKVFSADIIYHLFDSFTKHNAEVLEAKRKESAPSAVWPCRLKILKCFAKRDPIIVGCDLLEGQLRVGTPICVVRVDPTTKKKDIIRLGKVTGLEINHKSYQVCTKKDIGAGVAVKIERAVYEPARIFQRHFNEEDVLVSQISRESIDTLKALFKEEVSKDEWSLIVKLKKLLDIP